MLYHARNGRCGIDSGRLQKSHGKAIGKVQNSIMNMLGVCKRVNRHIGSRFVTRVDDDDDTSDYSSPLRGMSSLQEFR